MRRLVIALGALVALLAIAAPALAESPSTPSQTTPAATSSDLFFYVDTVNGTRPVGAAPRPIGCTQTNNFRRGEQIVFRIWGSEAATGKILNTENVKYAYVKIPGLANMKLNWGPHGAANNRVWFWTAAWVVPASYPLGTVDFRVVFKTESNKLGQYDQRGMPDGSLLNVVP